MQIGFSFWKLLYLVPQPCHHGESLWGHWELTRTNQPLPSNIPIDQEVVIESNWGQINDEFVIFSQE